MAVKECIECGEMVSEDVKTCPHCGKEDPTSGAISELLKGGSEFLKAGIAIAFLIWWSPWSSNDKAETNNSTSQTSYSEETTSLVSEINNAPVTPIMQVNINDIISAYKSNEVGADNKYKYKLIEVTGRIINVKKNYLNNLYVELGTGAKYETPQIHAFFDDSMNNQLGELQQGRQLTVICRIDGLDLNRIFARDCVIK